MHPNRFIHFLLLIISCAIVLSAVGCGKDNPQVPDQTASTPDTIPPATVMDLTARTPTASTIALVWFAPRDDGTSGQAAMYDIRYSYDAITEQNWEAASEVFDIPAPKPAGQLETVIIKGLPSNRQIYFALKTFDEVPNESELSNNAIETTLQEFSPPATINDLKAVAVTETDFLLTWTAPGDDWMEGTASEYDIRYGRFAITEENWSTSSLVDGEPLPKPAGNPDSFTVAGLQPNTNYYFAIKAIDDVGNQSAMSNLSPALALGQYLIVSPLRPNIGDDVLIVFRTSANSVTKVIIWRRFWVPYAGYQWIAFRHLVNEQFQGESQTVIWDTTNDDGETEPNPWSQQYRVKLHWGDAIVDTLNFQVLQ